MCVRDISSTNCHYLLQPIYVLLAVYLSPGKGRIFVQSIVYSQSMIVSVKMSSIDWLKILFLTNLRPFLDLQNGYRDELRIPVGLEVVGQDWWQILNELKNLIKRLMSYNGCVI